MNQKTIPVGVISLGCPKNTADTESILAELSNRFKISPLEKSEIVLLNTCAFLKSARDEAYGTLKNLSGKKVILLGCLTGLLKKNIFKHYPQLYAVVSGIHYPAIGDIISEVAEEKKIFAVSPEPRRYIDMAGKLLITPPSYAYLKIAEGCNNACSFCLIPSLKGHYRSRPMISILREARNLIKLGIKEIILVAQDCGYYGIDLYKEKTLSKLLKKLSLLKGDFWIRVLYVYPERIDDPLLEVMAGSPKICKYLDIPLQHGDPDILKAMRRPYDISRTLQTIERIRDKIPKITLRTSLITGFPGEKETHFKNLLTFIRKIQFDHVGIFEYSREKGTKAHEMGGQVPQKTKKVRRKQAMLLQQKISHLKNQPLIGQTCRVLIEQYDAQKKVYHGRTERFAPEIDGQVLISSKKPLQLNKFYTIKIKKTGIYDLYGEVF